MASKHPKPENRQVQRSWTPILRNLTEYFEAQESRLALIRSIDRRVVEDRRDVDELLQEVAESLAKDTHATAWGFYLLSGSGKEEIFLKHFASTETLMPVLDGERASRLNQSVDSIAMQVQPIEEIDFVFTMEALDKGSVLLLPIVPGGSLFGVLLLFGTLSPEYSHFSAPEIADHCQMVRTQLEIALRVILDRRVAELTQSFIDAVFQQNLKPSTVLNTLVSEIGNFLPSYGPLDIQPPPKAQILFYYPADLFLTIRATQGAEQFNTPVFLEESICGLLIEQLKQDPNAPRFLNVDPHDYPERYQWYLESESTEPPHSELAVAVMWNEQPIGVINLEHPAPKVFLRQHEEGLELAAASLAPFLQAIQERSERERDKERALLKSIDGSLIRMARQFRHRFRTPILSSRLSLDSLSGKISDSGQDVKDDLDTLSQRIDAMEAVAAEFSEWLPNFLKNDRYNVLNLWKDVLSSFDAPKLENDENIKVDLTCPADVHISCSAFMKEHLYNLFDNALYSVREMRAQGIRSEGKISIDVTTETRVPHSLRPDGKPFRAYRICWIVIRDNGKGAPKEIQDKLGTIGFTTKQQHGTGYGLAAAIEYCRSLGGDLTLDNRPDIGFEVKIKLDQA